MQDRKTAAGQASGTQGKYLSYIEALLSDVEADTETLRQPQASFSKLMKVEVVVHRTFTASTMPLQKPVTQSVWRRGDWAIAVRQPQASFPKPMGVVRSRAFAASTMPLQKPVTQSVWKRGDRVIALSSGGAFLGGLIAQVPGAVVGAVTGAIFGWFDGAETASHTTNS